MFWSLTLGLGLDLQLTWREETRRDSGEVRESPGGIPAVIGAGESLFNRWRAAHKLCLDCTNQKVLLIA